MTNRELLIKKIEAYANAEIILQSYYERDMKNALQEATKLRNEVMKDLYDFVKTLNLDPGLETWEQAAKRTYHVKFDSESWENICRFHRVDREVIDTSKT